MTSIVQSVANNNGAGATTLVLTIASATAGNLLVVCLGPRSTHTIAASGVSTNVGGTVGWVVVNPSGGTQNPDTLASNIPAFAYKLSAGGGETTVTITLDSSGVAGGFCTESNYTGNTIAFNDVRVGSNGSIAVTSWTSKGTVGGTDITAPGAAIGFGITSAGSTGLTIAPSGSWVSMSGTGITSGSNTNATDADQVYGETQIFASGGNYSATGTTTSATMNSGLILFNLTPTGGGGAGSRNRLLLGVG